MRCRISPQVLQSQSGGLSGIPKVSLRICPFFQRFRRFRRGHDVDVFTLCVNEHRAYERNGVDKILTPRRRSAHSACETEREFVNKAQDVKGRKRNEKRVARV